MGGEGYAWSGASSTSVDPAHGALRSERQALFSFQPGFRLRLEHEHPAARRDAYALGVAGVHALSLACPQLAVVPEVVAVLDAAYVVVICLRTRIQRGDDGESGKRQGKAGCW